MSRFPAILVVLAAFAGTPQGAPPDGARQQSRVIVPDANRRTYEGWGYAPAIVTRDGTIYLSGDIVKLQGEGSYEQRYAAGFRTTIQRIEQTLIAAGASLDDVVELTSYHTDLQRQIQTAVKTRMELMRPPHPAWTAVGTTALASPDAVTEIRVTAKVRAAR